MKKIKGKIDCVKNEEAIDIKMPQHSDEIRRAEYMMLMEALNKNNINDKKNIDNKNDSDKITDNRKGVSEMNKVEKKVVSLTHTKTSTHLVHLPVKWVKELDIEDDVQIVLEYDADKKKITISKL
ncbi:MAG: hypothetical protein J6S67_21785 [Methanobrevibacter sp.]|nr:hypothetical protein [Methanobrevibacter sp.]